uniref:TIL domain-containing protein n=1 Tax=Steinernema glaseri TaxID=37863 RepID=A0A1I7YL00_9BILA
MKSFFVVFALAFALVSAHPLEEKQCEENEHFASSECNGCDLTCFGREHTICPLMCYPPKCMCNKGFYRDPMNRCVAPQQCPQVLPPRGNGGESVRKAEKEPKCGQNEHFSASNCNGCDFTCRYRERTPCPAMCYPPKCMCNKGFYRDPMNRCVAPQQCPQILPPFKA